MKAFEHVDATSIEEAMSWLGEDWNVRIIAGGTDLLGEMKRGIIAPTLLLNIKTIPGLSSIEVDDRDGLRIGPLVTLGTIENSEIISARTPILSQAASAAASPQLRNMGTLGGNICQRPRCWYYRGEFPCLRKGGRQCFALGGDNRYHAILGGGPCFIVHPSDTAPALIALDAELCIAGSDGTRTLSVGDFFVGPRVDPHRENILKSNQMITQIRIPPPAEGSRGIYLKLRERQSWAFALVSVAAQVTMDSGRCREARIVLGGVSPIPWRCREAETEIEGSFLKAEDRERAARAALAGANPMRDNAYKVTMARNLVRHALVKLAGEGYRGRDE
jgi:xanthine dehydrogenase YagS FAD-binding subunit